MEEELSKAFHALLLEDNMPVENVTDSLRVLRNKCAENPEIQTQLGQQDMLLNDVNFVINNAIALQPINDEEKWTLCLRICAQFVGNLVVNNPENQLRVWTQCNEQIKKMVYFGDEKISNAVLMCLYNILLGYPHFLKDIVDDKELIEMICKAGVDGVEFASYIICHMLRHDVNWLTFYRAELTLPERIYLLDVFDKCIEPLPTYLICQLAKQFREKSDIILSVVVDQVDTLEPLEVVKLLKLVAIHSVHPPTLHALQRDQNFFIICAFLLKSVHMAGKEPNNCFSPVNKLSNANDKINCHPVFEFKANLVRLLGNLVYQHKVHQDMMREYKIISAILDCCSIDAKNPFITQWVVLAVRNLCEGNKENQAIIAGLSRNGFIQSPVVTEMGLALKTDANTKRNSVPNSENNADANNDLIADNVSDYMTDTTNDTFNDSMTDTINDTMADPITDTINDTMADPITDTINDTMAEPITDTINDTMADPITDTINDTIADPIADTMTDPITDTMTDPITDTMADPIPNTRTDPINNADTDGENKMQISPVQ